MRLQKALTPIINAAERLLPIRSILPTGTLTLLNTENTVSAPTCHITLDHSGKTVIVSSYHGGMIGLSPLLEDGQIGATADVQTA